MTRGRHRFDLMLAPVGFFALMGVGLSCSLIAIQVVNPSRQILSLAHYRDYQLFFGMGERLTEFGVLGALGAFLTLVSFLAWGTHQMGLLSWWRRAWSEGVSLASLPIAGLRVLFLYGVAAAGGLGLLYLDVVAGSTYCDWHAVLTYLVLLAVPFYATILFVVEAVCLHAAYRRDLRDLCGSWRGGGWSAWTAVTAALATGATLASVLAWRPGSLADLAGAYNYAYVVPPFLWTHFGPWGILACVTGTMALLGLAVGIVTYGLAPGETDDTVPPGRAPLAGKVAIACAAFALTVYALILVPRYQIGQDLRHLLKLSQGTVEGRTVVWLDKSRPSHRVAAFTSWATTDNMERVSQWILHAPWPSAQTRPAAVTLGNRALYDWDPDQALRWLDIQRDRQPHDSNLNLAMAEMLRRTMLSPQRASLARAFTDGNRFAWPGGVSHLRVAELLHRCGDETEALAWWAGGEDLLGPVDSSALSAWRREFAEPPPQGEIRGRLLRGGKPLPGARVALFRTVAAMPNGEESLASHSQEMVEQEPGLATPELEWNPSRHDYMCLRNLRDLYAVVVTDADGSFRFTPLDGGRYLLAVRLPGPPTADVRVENGVGFPLLVPGRMSVDLGTVQLRDE